jgi:dTDP-4-amino-4,6-dideoxygalactose transaminase
MINVTKTFLPSFEEYSTILKRAWDKSWITNNGELVQELEQKLKEYLDVKHLFFTSNGTVVLQIALKALNITKEVITTPFSYVATTNAILWEGCTPVFVDIDAATCCIDAYKIEAAITENTQAILATHVYGLPCNVDVVEKLASKYQLKIIYDGAHTFGAKYNNKAILKFGDISTCSFHATKLFHTVEGGCIICDDDSLAKKLLLYRQFGHIGDDYFSMGINGKNSEFHAAMGLAVLPKMDDIIARRKEISNLYDSTLNFSKISKPIVQKEVDYNFAYYPILFENENILLKVIKDLNENDIVPRRYFYPSLNQLPFLDSNQSCPVSESMSSRVLTLPLYYDLSFDEVKKITAHVNQHL